MYVMLGAFIAALSSSGPESDAPMLVPKPVRVEVGDKWFRIPDRLVVGYGIGDGDLSAAAKLLRDYLEDSGVQASIRAVAGDHLPPCGVLLTTVGADPTLGEEGYALEIRTDGVTIRAPSSRGVLWGVQTLRQAILGSRDRSLRCCRIWDKPRFRWRGSLLDCCRHFMTKDFVKRYIDLLALHKLNVFHWHLTEDQGWRIQIARYPELTQKGAWRGEGPTYHGGFYTQREVREVVQYAAVRGVMVVPEIEMPGHCMAALACYPDLSCTGGPFEVPTRWGVYEDVYCAGNERVFEFLEGVLTEVARLFPAPYVHIGGDEVPKARWQQCSKCQERIRAERLRDENELQSYFIRRIERILARLGKRLIGWDEILEGGLAPNAIVQAWRGMGGAVAAAKQGHDVICSPTSHCYLDYSHEVTSLHQSYSFEPIPPELSSTEAKHVLGGEGNIWTEHAPQELVEERGYPRLCALAEVFWSPREARDWKDFLSRMEVHYRRLDELGVRYYLGPPGATGAGSDRP